MNKNELIKKQICSFLDRTKPETRFIHIQTINENGHIIDRLKTGYITEPEYIRYTYEDDLLGMKIKVRVRAANSGNKYLIVKQGIDTVTVLSDSGQTEITYDDLLEYDEHLNGTPAGKKAKKCWPHKIYNCQSVQCKE